jgi:hypothetical protein
MTTAIIPDFGVDIPPGISYLDLRERAEAACNTVKLLEEQGLDVTPDEADNTVASILATTYAEDPDKTSKKVSNTKLTTLTPASIVQTQLILKEFSHLVATNAAEIRNLVTNKLVLETENADPRIRMRALELLGKISDVGLFAERKEVTITHQNTTELQEKLRTKLEKLKNLKKNIEGVYEVVDTEDIEDAEIVEADE